MANKLFESCNHIGIYVADREKAIEFYEKVLGFTLLFRSDRKASGIKLAMLELGNCRIEVLELPQDKDKAAAAPAAAATLNHFAVNVEDIEAAKAHVESFGYKFEERGIYDVPAFGDPNLDLLVAFFHGPNGERIELFREIRK